ncbi:MAG: lytic transglycosylase domain-containing protein [Bryobacteraceae bacterium]
MRLLLLLMAMALAAQEPSEKPAEKPPDKPVRADAIRKRMEQGLTKQRRAVRKQIGTAVGSADSGADWFTVPWTKPPSEEFVAPITPAEPVPSPPPAAAEKAGDTKASAAVRNFCPPVSTATLDSEIQTAATRNNLSERLLRALINRESSFDPCAVSGKGALGLMQLMPSTAQEFGVADPFDPIQSIQAGARYLAQLISRYGGDLRLALSAYNAGPTAVDRFGGVPPFAETRDFVEAVLAPQPVVPLRSGFGEARGAGQ